MHNHFTENTRRTCRSQGLIIDYLGMLKSMNKNAWIEETYMYVYPQELVDYPGIRVLLSISHMN